LPGLARGAIGGELGVEGASDQLDPSARGRVPTGRSHPAGYWHALGDGRLQCDLCPRECRLREGQRGYCFARMREGDQLVLTTYGRSSGFCLDPIEKKPLNHFFPGSSTLSFGGVGCNLGCRFCQNWDISTSRRLDLLLDQASPEEIALAAQDWGARSVAFTYNDPVIVTEYAVDVASACRRRGVGTVAVTAGYVQGAARRDFFAAMDAANVDLKGFTDEFYRRLSGGRLSTVLDTLAYLRHETDVWVEITTLVIPGHNDSEAELTAMCRWIARELGPDVPQHFTAFHPDHRMGDVPRTPAATLTRARQIALNEGLRFVYLGNVRDQEGATTWCPQCGAALIERDGHRLLSYRLTPQGRCATCGLAVPGRFAAEADTFGPRRIPITLGR
jgi:pyruvate formate lyase activating enzyme